MKTSWQKIYSEDGTLVYEGFTVDGKANGAGTAYYSSGMPMQEGIFGIKGLVIGREYYPNGQIRFEGIYRVNHSYGPNYPEYGTWYDDKDGARLYHGSFDVKKSGTGYPMVIKPDNYGTAAFMNGLGEHTWLFGDDKKRRDSCNDQDTK